MRDVRDMFENSPSMVCTVTDRERVTSAFGGGLSVQGLSPHAVVGLPVSDVGMIDPEMHRDALRGRHGVRRVFTQSNGGTRTLVTAYGPRTDPAAEAPIGMVAVTMDVTILEVDTIARVEKALSDIVPFIRSVSEAETRRIEVAAAEAARADRESVTRWAALERIGAWAGKHAGYPLTVGLTALAFYVAQLLGVIDVVRPVIPAPTPAIQAKEAP